MNDQAKTLIRELLEVSDAGPELTKNANLFAILADVRNGRGFAGVDTGISSR